MVGQLAIDDGGVEVVLSFHQNLPQARSGFGEVGAEFDRAFEGSVGAGVVVEGAVDFAEFVVDLRGPAELGGSFEGATSGLEVAEADLGDSYVRVDFTGVGGEFDGLLEGLQGVAVFALLDHDDTEGAVGLPGAGLNGEPFTVDLEGIDVGFLFFVEGAETEVGVCFFAIEGDGLAVGAFGSVGVAVGGEDVGEADLVVCVFGVEVDRLAEAVRSGSEVTALGLNVGDTGVDLGVARVESLGLLVDAEGAIVLQVFNRLTAILEQLVELFAGFRGELPGLGDANGGRLGDRLGKNRLGKNRLGDTDRSGKTEEQQGTRTVGHDEFCWGFEGRRSGLRFVLVGLILSWYRTSVLLPHWLRAKSRVRCPLGQQHPTPLFPYPPIPL